MYFAAIFLMVLDDVDNLISHENGKQLFAEKIFRILQVASDHSVKVTAQHINTTANAVILKFVIHFPHVGWHKHLQPLFFCVISFKLFLSIFLGVCVLGRY